MRLTTKGRFAVTAMIDLAMRQAEGPVTLAGISKRQKISLSYLEQLFGKLRRDRIVESTRGPGGGYSLCRDGSTITVADIITAVDEPIDATQCGGKGNCHGQDELNMQCMTHDLWSNLNKKMVDYLQSVTLKDLVAQQEQRQVVVLSPFINQNKPAQIAPNKNPSLNVVDAKSAKKEPAPKRFIVNSVFNLAQQN
ncbi:Fe-S cluster assembly transcriptional regulator IscR [Polynucleobacter sp. SHI8]|jgi:Rrf2 family iron-sulfur cluster assembly transcriptional regulator|uniref:Fe-S cluster assembly transcription factor n=1 Tax=unclassified Polynucleobacter TaxID=2640945 RepID=UPI002492F829|nr:MULTISPECIES: Fe-S cluster assembly transcription factor [unclassified Polynucleobacter]BDW10790.1 Fe-S cluster assembly transcriptional regulator IscR [Polynucleobacter sp. SHI2]BDW13236.1 Fe-S cluster assembly transcriptional regulator IscR [Polynucleobacter sp. SHI8]